MSRDGALGRPGTVFLDHDAGGFVEGRAIGFIIGLDGVAAPVDEDELLVVGRGRTGGAQRQRRRAEKHRGHLREAAAADLAGADLGREDVEAVFAEGVVHGSAPA